MPLAAIPTSTERAQHDAPVLYVPHPCPPSLLIEVPALRARVPSARPGARVAGRSLGLFMAREAEGRRMTDRCSALAHLHLYPPERRVQMGVFASAVRRLEEALAWRQENGAPLPRPGRVQPIPLESLAPLSVCPCGRWIDDRRERCDRCMVLGLVRRRA